MSLLRFVISRTPTQVSREQNKKKTSCYCQFRPGKDLKTNLLEESEPYEKITQKVSAVPRVVPRDHEQHLMHPMHIYAHALQFKPSLTKIKTGLAGKIVPHQ